MTLTEAHVRALADVVGLEIPDADLAIVKARLEALLLGMEAVEAELGAEMDLVEPVPPVYPAEPG